MFVLCHLHKNTNKGLVEFTNLCDMAVFIFSNGENTYGNGLAKLYHANPNHVSPLMSTEPLHEDNLLSMDHS